jgi:hypothetical protein
VTVSRERAQVKPNGKNWVNLRASVHAAAGRAAAPPERMTNRNKPYTAGVPGSQTGAAARLPRSRELRKLPPDCAKTPTCRIPGNFPYR